MVKRFDCTTDHAFGVMELCDLGEWVEFTDYHALAVRCKEHEQFRHQHRECDAMGVENQHLRARLAEVEHDLATLRLFVLTHDEGLLTEFDEFGLSNAVSAPGEKHE